MIPSPPAVRSVLPSRLRLRPMTPGFGFCGIGGDGVQRVCAWKDVTPKTRTTTTAKPLYLSELNLKPCGHAIKRLAIDAEDFRGAFAIVPGRLEHVKDVASLDLVEVRQAGKDFGKIVCGEWWQLICLLKTNTFR